MQPKIKNCVLGFQCPVSWDDLPVIDNAPNKKHCGHCQQDISLCQTQEELDKAIEDNVCVAVDFVAKGYDIRVLGFPSRASSTRYFGDTEE